MRQAKTSGKFVCYPVTIVRVADRMIVVTLPDLDIIIRCEFQEEVVKLLCAAGDRELQNRADRGDTWPDPSRLEDVPLAQGNVALRVTHHTAARIT
jgi:hypothetical protein